VIRDLHHVVAWILIVTNAAVGVWALAADRRPRLRHRLGWIMVVIAQVVVLIQTVLGVVLQVSEDIEGDRHQLYGFTAFISVGLLYAYRNEMRDRPYLLYGLGSLWLMGLGIRGVYLAG